MQLLACNSSVEEDELHSACNSSLFSSAPSLDSLGSIM